MRIYFLVMLSFHLAVENLYQSDWCATLLAWTTSERRFRSRDTQATPTTKLPKLKLGRRSFSTEMTEQVEAQPASVCHSTKKLQKFKIKYLQNRSSRTITTRNNDNYNNHYGNNNNNNNNNNITNNNRIITIKKIAHNETTKQN
jgi:hypothetical protein